VSASNIILPVKFGVFAAKKTSTGILLDWTIDAEENTKGYEIERSADGVNYKAIGSIKATGSRSYSFIDVAPLANSFYRIKAFDNDLKYGYSQVVRMRGTESAVEMKAFFNNSTSLTIQHDQAPSGSMVSIITTEGRILRSIPVAAGAQQTLVDVPSARAGLVIVQFHRPGSGASIIKLLKP
jgi:hypothetical protein